MNHCSYFIKDKALFGSYPTQTSVYELENLGNVRCFIDLTEHNEKNIHPYTTSYEYIHFPIKDRGIPTALLSFSAFIVRVSKIIRKLLDHQTIYIHCRGGHGRSGLVVACILCYIFKMNPYDALIYTSKCHSNRSIMRDKWRRIGSPQTYNQKKFVYKMFQGYNFNKIYKNLNIPGFFTHLSYNLYIKELGMFSNIFEAFYEFERQYMLNKNSPIFHFIRRKDENYEKIKLDIMEYLLDTQFNQHIHLKENLVNTFLRPIIAHFDHDKYWGFGKDENGFNNFGKILYKLKCRYLLEI